MKPQCPSVVEGAGVFTHEDCQTTQCYWWEKRCTAVDTIPVATLMHNRQRKKRLDCALASHCRWMLQSIDGLCPPMKMGEVCEHQGGTYNTSLLDGYSM
jgi:hypothetical protein